MRTELASLTQSVKPIVCVDVALDLWGRCIRIGRACEEYIIRCRAGFDANQACRCKFMTFSKHSGKGFTGESAKKSKIFDESVISTGQQ